MLRTLADLTRTTRPALVAVVVGVTWAVAGCSGGGMFFTPGPHSMDSAALNGIVAQQSRSHGVDANLLRAVINQESGGDPSAVSDVGAMGLMQLMPGTASAYGVYNPYDPAQNVNGGAAYLADLLREYKGNVALALAAYNAGSGAVSKYGGIPPYAETQAYVRSILSQYKPAK